jgi:rhamnogalacturonyl hydrolase YesR
MSATAAFAYALSEAVKTGHCDKKYIINAQNALDALKADIDGSGNVIHGSIGTCVMDDYRAYNSVGYGYTYFTQGLAMMALSV